MSLEEDKLKLEIAELRQKARWEPFRSWITMIGVAVLFLGLGVERCSEVERRNFEVSLQLHESKIGEMTRIAAETARLCERTATVVRENKRIRVFGKGMANTLKQMISKISAPMDSEDAWMIKQVLVELENYEEAFATELDDYQYWVEAVELEALWKHKASSPAPSFSLYFGKDLQVKWPSVAETTKSALTDTFSLNVTEASSPNSTLDIDDIIGTCLGFITLLESKIYDKRRDFCEHHGNRGTAC